MSHFTKCATKITNIAALKTALDQLGLKYRVAEEGQPAIVRGYQGQTLEAEICVDMGSYDIGVVRATDGTYSFEADWWGVETTNGKTEQDFANEVNQKYAYVRVVEACEKAGYSMDTSKVNEDGTVQLNVVKWG